MVKRYIKKLKLSKTGLILSVVYLVLFFYSYQQINPLGGKLALTTIYFELLHFPLFWLLDLLHFEINYASDTFVIYASLLAIAHAVFYYWIGKGIAEIDPETGIKVLSSLQELTKKLKLSKTGSLFVIIYLLTVLYSSIKYFACTPNYNDYEVCGIEFIFLHFPLFMLVEIFTPISINSNTSLFLIPFFVVIYMFIFYILGKSFALLISPKKK